jgi:hypothetical protein
MWVVRQGGGVRTYSDAAPIRASFMPVSASSMRGVRMPSPQADRQRICDEVVVHAGPPRSPGESTRYVLGSSQMATALERLRVTPGSLPVRRHFAVHCR